MLQKRSNKGQYQTILVGSGPVLGGTYSADSGCPRVVPIPSEIIWFTWSMSSNNGEAIRYDKQTEDR